MFSNKNIVKYCVKYFIVMTVMAYIFNLSASLVNQKSDVANLVGSVLFAGLLLVVGLVLKSDVTKLVKNLKNENNNE
jgi:uncharacterized Tic20 family protein